MVIQPTGLRGHVCEARENMESLREVVLKVLARGGVH